MLGKTILMLLAMHFIYLVWDFYFYNLIIINNLVNKDLLKALNNLDYYKITGSKSLGREFIEKEHHYINSAQKYLDTWRST